MQLMNGIASIITNLKENEKEILTNEIYCLYIVLNFKLLYLHIYIFHSFVITDNQNKIQYSFLNTKHFSCKMDAFVVDLHIFL